MDEEKENNYFYFFIGLGAIATLWRLKMQSSVVAQSTPSLQNLSKSYNITCESFKIQDKPTFGKFHKLLVKRTFESFELPVIKILEFHNYVLGYCKRYVTDILKFKGTLYCKLDTMDPLYGGYDGDISIPEWTVIYYILSLDAITDLGNLLPIAEQGKYRNLIAPGYIQILADSLNFDQDAINDATEIYLQYKETGEI